MEFSQGKVKLKEEYVKIGFNLLEDSENGLVFQTSSAKIFIPNVQIEGYAKNLTDIDSNYRIIHENCGIVSKNYREQIINIKTQGIHGIHELDEISVEYSFGESGAGAYAKIGPASDFFLDLLRFDNLYVEKFLYKFHEVIMRREKNVNPRAYKDYIHWNDYAYRPPTIKILDLNEEDIDRAEQKSSAIIDSCFFAFADKKRIILNLVEEYQSAHPTIVPLDYKPIIKGDIVDLPQEVLNSDMVRIYKRGVMAEDPFIQFLSFYQILEFCFRPNMQCWLTIYT
jgi:hypothetical protein